MAYGLPYQGSKNLIARELLQQMPRRDWFVDLFAGGGSGEASALQFHKLACTVQRVGMGRRCDKGLSSPVVQEL